MIEGAPTVGYSSSTTAEGIGGKYLGSFPGFSQRSDHHIVGTGSATTNTSSLPTSRMHLVDSWRESIMKHSYEKQVSVFFQASMLLQKMILNILCGCNMRFNGY